MSIYRCAVCGSSKVVPETKQEGYNKKKGIFGMAMFGLGGAVAGASGNTVVYYHCAECGHTLNRCMSDFEKNNIDRCLLDPNSEASRALLKIQKSQYPNIEWEEPIKEETSNNENVIQNNEIRTAEQEKRYKELREKILQDEKTRRENYAALSDHDIEIYIIKALYEIGKPCGSQEFMRFMKGHNFLAYDGRFYKIAKKLAERNIIESTDEKELHYRPILSSEEETLNMLQKE